MRQFAILLLLGLGACGKSGSEDANSPARNTAPVPPVAATPSMVSGNPATAQAAMIPVPADKQQLDRMLAMGYTVHEDHMHAPGVKECPFNMGGSVVQ